MADVYDSEAVAYFVLNVGLCIFGVLMCYSCKQTSSILLELIIILFRIDISYVIPIPMSCNNMCFDLYRSTYCPSVCRKFSSLSCLIVECRSRYMYIKGCIGQSLYMALVSGGYVVFP